MQIDYRNLLVEYMANVINQEGDDFLSWLIDMPAHEKHELEKISREAEALLESRRIKHK